MASGMDWVLKMEGISHEIDSTQDKKAAIRLFRHPVQDWELYFEHWH